VRAMSFKLLPVASIVCLTAMTAACGNLAGQDRSSVIVVIDALEAASGAEDGAPFTGTLQSDVVTVVNNASTVFSDSGRVTMRVIGKDPTDTLGATNSVTITRYLVTFRRSDGRNTPGVDVPFPFDSAVTFTVTPGSTSTTGSFELIRHTAKLEPPLLGLRDQNNNINWTIISTLADVTFFGHDQSGRNVSASGRIGIQFGDFADPTN
jgi:hypothetical protein